MTNKPIAWTTEEPQPVKRTGWVLRIAQSTSCPDYAERDATEDDLRLAGFTRSTREVELARANEDAWHRVAQLEAERDEAIARAETAEARLAAESAANDAMVMASSGCASEPEAPNDTALEDIWTCLGGLDDSDVPAVTAMATELLAARRRESREAPEDVWCRGQLSVAAVLDRYKRRDEGSARVGEHPSSEFSPAAIAVARADGNLRVDRNGLGWIRNMAPDMPAVSPPDLPRCEYEPEGHGRCLLIPGHLGPHRSIRPEVVLEDDASPPEKVEAPDPYAVKFPPTDRRKFPLPSDSAGPPMRVWYHDAQGRRVESFPETIADFSILLGRMRAEMADLHAALALLESRETEAREEGRRDGWAAGVAALEKRLQINCAFHPMQTPYEPKTKEGET